MRRTLPFLICLLITCGLSAQTAGVSMDLKVIMQDYRSAIGGKVFGDFTISEKVFLQPSIALFYFTYSESHTTVNHDSSRTTMTWTRYQGSYLTYGLNLDFTVFELSDKLALLMGTGVDLHSFSEKGQPFKTAFRRPEIRFPITLKEISSSNPNVRYFISLVPGRLLASDKQEALQPGFGKGMNMISLNFGILLDRMRK